MKQRRILGIDEILDKIGNSISLKDKYTFYIAFVTAVLFYFPMLTDWLGNPDSFWNGIVYKNGSAWENKLGRFGLTLGYKLKEYIISPTWSTFFSFLMLALICVLLRRLFEINQKWMIFCMVLIVDLTPSVMSTLTYYYCSDMYFFAYFLNVMAVYLLTTGKRRREFFLAVIMLCYALTCYQAYISVAVTICTLVIWRVLMEGKESLYNVIKLFWKYFGAGVLAGILYFTIFKLLQILLKIEPASKFIYPSFKNLFSLCLNTYRYFIQYFFTNGFLYNEWGGRKYWNIIFVLFSLLLFVVYSFRNRKNVAHYVVSGLCISLLPIAFILVTVVAPSGDIYGPTGILTIPAMNFAYLIPIILLSLKGWREECSKGKKILEWIGGFLLFRIVLLLIAFVSAFQGYLQLNLSRMRVAAGELNLQIATIESERTGSNEEIPVVFAGKMPEMDYHNLLIDSIYGTTAEHGMVWDSYSGGQQSWIYFLRHVTGKGYKTVSEEECQKIMSTEEFKEIPLFPANGSVKAINDIVVVKLSNGNE